MHIVGGKKLHGYQKFFALKYTYLFISFMHKLFDVPFYLMDSLLPALRTVVIRISASEIINVRYTTFLYHRINFHKSP